MTNVMTLGEVATYINGRAFKPSEWEETGLPIIRIQNLTESNKKYNYSSRLEKTKKDQFAFFYINRKMNIQMFKINSIHAIVSFFAKNKS